MYAVFALLLFLSGLRTGQGGIFYLGDAAALAMFGWGFAKRDISAWLPKIKRLTLGLGFFVVGALFLDLWNRVPYGDIGRGFGRNFIFSASVLGGLFVIRKHGLKAWAWLLFWMTLGFPVCAFIVTPEYTETIPLFAKFGGGASLMIAASIFLARFDKRVSALVVVAGAVFFFLSSFRGMTVMCVAAGAGAMTLPLKTAGDRFRFLLALALVGALLGLWMLGSFELSLSSLLGDATLSMQERSSMSRADMASTAWSYFLANPFTGIGTWQHARNYTDILGEMELIGVHSVLIQLACEYGIIGLIMGTTVLVVTVFAVYRMAFTGTTDNDMVAMALIWSAVMISYNFLFSPFNGDSRFYYGLMFSGLVAVLLRCDTGMVVLRARFPAPAGAPAVAPGPRSNPTRG